MPERVLIVEDDREVREAVADYLDSHGFSCVQAGDGKAMRAALAEAVPDLVLLDLRLPGEDGLSLARWLRDNHEVAISW
jgi:two-component system phosphate regulon response regulator OmpR